MNLKMKFGDKNTEQVKFLRIMRAIVLFLFLGIGMSFASNSYSQETLLSISAENKTVKDVFKQIESSSEFIIFCMADVVDLDRKVSLNLEGQNIETILNFIFRDTDNTFKIEDRQVIITKKTSNLQSPSVSQQNKTKVTGVVTDTNGESVIGASVVEKGTTNGITTDIDGRYEISVSGKNAVLSISYLGYVTQDIKVDGRRNINVQLYEDSKTLEEVVVTAYGTGQKKESLVGSIQTVRPSDLKVPATNLTTAFAGRLAGVIAVQQTGEPGADGANFWIRGVSTFGSNTSPLIIIDGVEANATDLNALDPEVIEGFSILKDATATAMYGMRGANGVMIVTTKSGMAMEKPIINFRIEGSMNQPTKIPEFVDGVRFMELYNEAIYNQPAGKEAYTQERIEGTRLGLNPYIFPNVDWYNELFDDRSFSETFNFNIRGGGRKVDYFSSASVSHESGMLKDRSKDFFSYSNNINRMRYSFQNNINAHLSKTSKLSLRLNVMLVDKRSPQQSTGNIFSSVMAANPVDAPIMFPKEAGDPYIKWGVPAHAEGPSYSNPLAYMTTGYNDTFQSTVIASLSYDQKLDFITSGLSFKAMASFKNFSNSVQTRTAGWNKFLIEQYGKNEEGIYDYKLKRFSDEVGTTLSSSSSNTGNRKIYFQAMLEYKRKFSLHDVGGLLIYNQDEYMDNNPGSNILVALPTRRQGFAARASYAYDNRYLAEINLGYNGSENFAKGNRFGFFPSVAVGYNISEEKFFEPLRKIISRMKIRATWGLVGNGDIGGERFTYLSNISLTGSAAFTTGINMDKVLSGPNYSRFSNNNLTWEVGEKINLGLDLTLLDKLNMSVDFFRENRDDIFQAKATIPNYFGMQGTTIYGNFGGVKNQGVDASLDIGHSFNKNLEFTFKGSFTYAHNEITKYEEAIGEYENLSKIGYSTNQAWGYIADHLFADQAEVDSYAKQLIGGTIGAGDIKYVNVTNEFYGKGDNTIDSNDRLPIGNPTVPEIVYGFGPSIRWKNFDISFFFQGVAKRSIFMSDLQPFGSNANNRNVQKFIAEDRWSPDNQNILAKYPRLTIETHDNNSAQSTYWMRNGAFLKLKNAEIGYTIKSMRFYLRGSNLLTFSPFKHWDPEQGGGNGLKYPTQRVFNLGFQMTIK